MNMEPNQPPRIHAPPGAVPPRLTAIPPRTAESRSASRRLIKASPAQPAYAPLFNPEEVERFKNLLVFAKSTVEGFFAGKHKSPYRGSSVEFADYKEYLPGDDVNRIDWRAYGRTRRLFVRQYEAETDMVVYLLVDASASMKYLGEARQSKYRTAARIAAALAYLMINQGDKASLVVFGQSVQNFVPPGGTRRHLHRMLTELERVEPASTTGMAQAIEECNTLFRKRGRVVILSDFWTETPALFEALGQLLHRKFEILLLQVLDRHEFSLPPAAMARFQDMETDEQVEVELEEIREDYQRKVRERIDGLAHEAHAHGIRHNVVRTERPYLEAIEAYLGFREANTLSAR